MCCGQYIEDCTGSIHPFNWLDTFQTEIQNFKKEIEFFQIEKIEDSKSLNNLWADLIYTHNLKHSFTESVSCVLHKGATHKRLTSWSSQF